MFRALLLGYMGLMIAGCSVKNYTVSNAHAHNDYAHPVPFYPSYNAGFGSIEADIFPVNGSLYVAHNEKDMRAGNTLQALYLQPLLSMLSADSLRHLRLLVDIKDNYRLSLSLLIKELQPLKPYLTSASSAGQLTILISGQRPPPSEYQLYPDYLFFDDDLKLPHTPEEWKRVGQVSLPFNKLSAWKGIGKLPQADKHILKHKIDSVHTAGKSIRFWAAPDTVTSWQLQKRLLADLIGTDKVSELAAWLK